MDMQGYSLKTAETDALPAIGFLEEPDTSIDLEIAAPLAACGDYRRAVYHRLETERAWAGDVAPVSDGALAVIRAVKAENAALAHYNRVLVKYQSPVPRETPRSAPNDRPLTPREHEVLNLIACGKITKEIAYDLGIAFKTAACHRYRIMEKLGVHSTAGLIRVAIKLGFIDP
jgi:DNA-binding CsgD family transcriptional regulator